MLISLLLLLVALIFERMYSFISGDQLGVYLYLMVISPTTVLAILAVLAQLWDKNRLSSGMILAAALGACAYPGSVMFLEWLASRGGGGASIIGALFYVFCPIFCLAGALAFPFGLDKLTLNKV